VWAEHAGDGATLSDVVDLDSTVPATTEKYIVILRVILDSEDPA
jgi:hypothetical protein